jgi:hypothetical protein
MLCLNACLAHSPRALRIHTRRAGAIRISRREGVSPPGTHDETAMNEGDAVHRDNDGPRCRPAWRPRSTGARSGRVGRRRWSPLPASLDLTGKCIAMLFGSSMFMQCKRLHARSTDTLPPASHAVNSNRVAAWSGCQLCGGAPKSLSRAAENGASATPGRGAFLADNRSVR